MNREEAREFVSNAAKLRNQLNNIGIIEAYAEGAVVEMLSDGGWKVPVWLMEFDSSPDLYRVKPKEYIEVGQKIRIEPLGLHMLCQVGPNKGMLISITEGNRYSDTIIELDECKAAREDVDAVVKEFTGSSYRVVEE